MRARTDRAAAAVLAAALFVGLSAGRARGATSTNHAPGAPTVLTVDDDTAPLAVEGAPQFGWRVNDDDNNEVQSAYEIVVKRGGKQVADTGKITSAQESYVTVPKLARRPDTQYTWTVRTWDRAGAAGPYAPEASFDTALAPTSWHAQWITRAGAGPPNSPDDFSLYRTRVEIAPSPIVRARVDAAAGQQYELFVNGARLAHGPSFSYPDEQYYETTDISAELHPDEQNVIAFVVHWSTPGQGRPPSVPALIAHVVVEHLDGTRQVLGTNGSWRAHAGPWSQGQLRNSEGDFIEQIDERKLDPKWTVGPDDPSWPRATVLGPVGTAPFTHLYAARTHIEFQPLRPVSIKQLPDGATVADFGSVVAATPVVQIHHGAAGRHVTLLGGYLLDPDGHVSSTQGIQETNMRWEFDERAGAQELRPFGYLGFRYLQITGAKESLTQDDVQVDARHAAMPDENAAQFKTSNAELDAVWNLARHSALYDSQEQFLDTPTREKGPFLGDSYDVSQATESAFGERALTDQALRDFARSQARYWPDGPVNAVYPNGDGKRDIPDATETYVQWVWHNYQVTGNQAELAALFPTVNRVVNYIARAIDPKTGLVTNLPGGGGDYMYGAVDWPPAMRYGYDMNTAARTTMNILAESDFDLVDRMAEILHRGNAVKVVPDDLRAAIAKHLVRPDGIFVDGLAPNGSQSAHASQQANAYALAFGLVPDDKVKTVADYVIGLGTNTGVDIFRVLLDAMHAAGRDDALVTELTDPNRAGYAQILREGATFTWESWNARQVGDSESHGWGSTVLDVLQNDILGVHLAEPGAARVAIAVPNTTLTSAQGVFATQRGPIAISWTRNGSHTTLDVTIPPNVVAQLPGSDNVLGSGHYTLTDYKQSAFKNSSNELHWWVAALIIAALIALIFAGAWFLANRKDE